MGDGQWARKRKLEAIEVVEVIKVLGVV